MRILTMLVALALGAACQKPAPVVSESDPGPPIPPEGATPTAPAPPDPHGHAEAAPLPVTPADPKRVDALAAKLPSPCGKAHSLAKSIETDKACKRAPHARSYVELLMSLGASDDETTQLYAARYNQENKAHRFELRETAFMGKPNAPVQIVEFFDYNCHHCRDKAPVLDALLKKYPDGVIVYFKNFPLQNNKDSAAAAGAALAAQRQGKFLEMHHKLFENAGAHDKASLLRYAKELGLDPSRFAADLSDPRTAARVEADRQEGIKAGIQGTPTVYVGGRLMSDPVVMELLVSWVDEELAVNR